MYRDDFRRTIPRYYEVPETTIINPEQKYSDQSKLSGFWCNLWDKEKKPVDFFYSKPNHNSDDSSIDGIFASSILTWLIFFCSSKNVPILGKNVIAQYAVVGVRMQPLSKNDFATLPEDLEIDDIEEARRPQFEIDLLKYDWY